MDDAKHEDGDIRRRNGKNDWSYVQRGKYVPEPLYSRRRSRTDCLCFQFSGVDFGIGNGNEIIAQKSAFLASTDGVTLSVAFQKKLGGGLFGGEGFIMQRLSGNGTAFVEIDGYVKEYELAAGQQMIIDTGYLAAMDASCTMDITTVKGLKNKVLGGEGFFNTVVTGPGKIYLQSMPINQMAGVLQPFLSTNK